MQGWKSLKYLLLFFGFTPFPEYSLISVSGDVDQQHIGFETINPTNTLLESSFYAFVPGYVFPRVGDPHLLPGGVDIH
jgi:hypothetical protein